MYQDSISQSNGDVVAEWLRDKRSVNYKMLCLWFPIEEREVKR